MKCVYRGVHAHHPALEAAKLGHLVPANLNGRTTPEAHNLGEGLEDSPFTSWTHDYEIAMSYARRYGAGGVVLSLPVGRTQTGDLWAWEWSPDVFGEGEILLRGPRTGATVELV
jgi:hypothetical protein